MNGCEVVRVERRQGERDEVASAASFTSTRMRLTVALSREPSASRPATASEMRMAGTLMRPPARRTRQQHLRHAASPPT